MMLTYSDAINPKWQNRAKTTIHIEVDWDHLDDEVYSPCSMIDLNGVEGEEHLADLWNRTLAGDFGPIQEYETPADYTPEETVIAFGIRNMRNDLLMQSDYAVANDRWHTMSEEDRQAWTEYRQALRDIPQNWTMTASYDDNEEVWKLPGEYTFPRAPE